jgi:hypothetical protein
VGTDTWPVVAGLRQEFIKVHGCALSLSNPVKRVVVVSAIPCRTITAGDDALCEAGVTQPVVIASPTRSTGASRCPRRATTSSIPVSDPR